ncbi:MAG: type II toxin-antitoxin system VapC family toxin [Deltaproteobacteria bacterium]|nr:type II toxin-antitoxin system VapC family toxin [Deltaproteobacteria bacterium]MBI2501341.1 type II toxin-antitoxin system VapC family toxin [Deltaproteobacteria bacterium]
MILPDINLLVYAHRHDAPQHTQAAETLQKLADSLSPFALTSFVLTGFLRIVTNQRIFVEPSLLDDALLFIENLLELDHCRVVEPGERHWEIMSIMLRESKATGNLVSDAYLAAVAVEHGCTLLTNDADFRRFPELRVQKF